MPSAAWTASASRTATPSPRSVVGELRQGQVKLASEQVRYQIAFREDLARLAEQVAVR